MRVGGVQALSRLIHDSPVHHDDVVEVLAAFVSDRAPAAAQPAVPPSQSLAPPQSPPADVQAALTALAHRPRRPERRAIALAGTCLAGADLTGANLAGADLRGTSLARADLRRADLADANLRDADLTAAKLAAADLTGADLSLAKLTGADLERATLRCAFARSADLTGANLAGADLTGANMSITNLTRAYLFGATLTRTYLSLANLTNADLTKADLQDVRGLLGEQLQQASNDAYARLKGKFAQPRWHGTPGPRDTPAAW